MVGDKRHAPAALPPVKTLSVICGEKVKGKIYSRTDH
jgi:hypothetical protein